MPGATDWTKLAIYRMFYTSEANPKKKQRLVWERQYTQPEESDFPKSFDYDPKSGLDDKLGDCAIIFRYDKGQGDKIVRIPRKVIGDTGSIVVQESMQGKFGWQPVIERWGATGHHPAKPKQSFDKSLSSVAAPRRQLLCTSRALGKQGTLGEFRCWYIDPEVQYSAKEKKEDPELRDGLVPVEDEVRTWLVEQADRELEKEKLLEKLLEKLKSGAKNLTNAKQTGEDEGLWDGTGELLEKLAENAVPDISGGTATPIIISNFISEAVASADIAAHDWTAGYQASLSAAAVGPAQGGVEVISVGWMAVLHIAAIDRLRKKSKKRKLSGQEQAQLKEHTKLLADLLIARGPVAIVDGINGGIAIAAANNYGQGIATLHSTVDPTGVAAIAGPASAFGSALSIAVNFYIAGRNFRQVDKSRKRRKEFLKQASKIEELSCRLNKDGEYEVDYDEKAPTPDLRNLQALRVYAKDKLGRRMARKGVTGGVALASIVGGTGGLVAGIATIVLATAIANAWNPVGWAFGALAIVGGIGVAAYMLHRRRTRKKRRTELEKQGKIASPEQFANKLLTFWVEAKKKNDPKLLPEATALLEIFVDSSKAEKDPKSAESEIARHFK